MIFKNKNSIRVVFRFCVYVFALIGFVFAGVYVAMKFHWTDVKGSIDSRNAYFNEIKKQVARIPSVNVNKNFLSAEQLSPVTECQILTISSVLPANGKVILDTYIQTKQPVIAEKMVRAVELVTTNNTFLKDKLARCDAFSDSVSGVLTASNQTIFDWSVSPEWQTLREALVKDKDTIIQASKDTGVSPRLIVSTVIAEQLRFFTANRESYKRYFEPLKLLGNGTKFSYGVAGVKTETAATIEANLKNPQSPFYLGNAYESLLDYAPGVDTDAERLNRLTDPKNHYYSYVYTAVFLKEIMNQWQQAGYPISDRPEVLATLFNLGFTKSVPKANPEVGGSTITVIDRDYTFGGLSYEFYYSGELADIFPLGVE